MTELEGIIEEIQAIADAIFYSNAIRSRQLNSVVRRLLILNKKEKQNESNSR